MAGLAVLQPQELYLTRHTVSEASVSDANGDLLRDSRHWDSADALRRHGLRPMRYGLYGITHYSEGRGYVVEVQVVHCSHRASAGHTSCGPRTPVGRPSQGSMRDSG